MSDDNKLNAIREYRKYPSRFAEDYLGISLTKTQKIIMDWMVNIDSLNNSFVVFPRWSGRKFYYDILNQVRKHCLEDLC